MGNFKLVNLWQSQEERRGKYWLTRSCGANSYQAMRMRDWRLAKIERHFGLEETFDPHTNTYTRELNTAGSMPSVRDQRPGIEQESVIATMTLN